jgi:hypothetical protein
VEKERREGKGGGCKERIEGKGKECDIGKR